MFVTTLRGGIDVCNNSSKTKFKSVVSFLTVCRSRSKFLKLDEKYAGASRPSCLFFVCNEIFGKNFKIWSKARKSQGIKTASNFQIEDTIEITFEEYLLQDFLKIDSH